MNRERTSVFDASELHMLIDLADIMELRYQVDCDCLEILDEQGKMLYSGSLSVWREEQAAGMENEGNKNNFLQFCERLEKGIEDFRFHIELAGKNYGVHCHSVSSEEKGCVVYGVLKAEKKLSEGEISYRRASDRDPMLDMLNKRAITEYAMRVMSVPDSPTVYIVIFDLDNFKVVNDTYGHLFGDEVLVKVTEILKNCVGQRGVIGRIGGDELMIVTRGVPDKAELRTILRDVRTTVEKTWKDALEGVSLTCSMGAAAYPDHAADYHKVMEIADKMLYLAKEKGRNRYLIYTPELHQDLILNPGAEKAGANSFLTTDNNALMQYLLEDFLMKKASSNEVAFRQTGTAFRLSEILTLYSNSRISFRWTPESITHDEHDRDWIIADDDFYAHFDENGMYKIDGLYNLKEKDQMLKDKFAERDIQSALFFRLKRKGRTDGFIMFAKKVQRQKWSEYEILALTTVAKIFEMSLYDAK